MSHVFSWLTDAIDRRARWLFPDRYELTLLTKPEELDRMRDLPVEIHFALMVRPSRIGAFRALLGRGFSLGVSRIERTPGRLLMAVERVSRLTQHNTIIPWLERLLVEGEMPVHSPEDAELASASGIDLTGEVKEILSQRHEFRKIMVVRPDGTIVGEAGDDSDEAALVHDVNKDLYPLSTASAVHRIVADSARARTGIARNLLKALVIIGPIAQILEQMLHGLGKIFAASIDDLIGEGAELSALRGSGFTWRQLIRRSRWLIVVFILATIGAFASGTILAHGFGFVAGFVFGLSAVAMSLTTAVQSVFLYRGAFLQLAREGKLSLRAGERVTWLAIRQDFINPARFGLLAGATAAPLVAALVFWLMPSLTTNGWVLALLGSIESVVAGLTVITSDHLDAMRFHARARAQMARMVPQNATLDSTPAVRYHP